MKFNRRKFLRNWRTALADATQPVPRNVFCWKGRRTLEKLIRADIDWAVKFAPNKKYGFRGQADWRSVKLLLDFRDLIHCYSNFTKSIDPGSELRQRLKRFRSVDAGVVSIAKDIGSTGEKASAGFRKVLAREIERLQGEREQMSKLWLSEARTCRHLIGEYWVAPGRRMDVDAKFQVVLGFVMCTSWGGKLTNKMIARLIELFYYSAGIADPPATLSGPFISKVTGRKISVSTIENNLNEPPASKLLGHAKVSHRKELASLMSCKNVSSPRSKSENCRRKPIKD